MGIRFAHQFGNILNLIAGHHRMQQADLSPAVSADPVNSGYTVPILRHIGFNHLIRHGRGDLHGHTLIPVVEGIDGLCGNKLEQNRIACIFPAEHKPEYRNQYCIEYKHITPDGFALLIGNIQCHKIHASGGSIALQSDHCHNTVGKSPEDHIQQNILKQRGKIQNP